MTKVDLHVHTKYSKHIVITTRLLTMVGARECYNELEKVYQTAKNRDMDFVTITDHDTIEGALILQDKYPEEIIVGEEIQVKAFDEGHFVHLVTLGINEAIHRDLTDLKNIGIEKTTAYLKKKGVYYYLAHIAHSASNQPLNPELIDRLMKYTDTLEVGSVETTLEENMLTAFIAAEYGKRIVAGSDAHVLSSIGKAFTVSDEATTKEEFLQALKQGKCYVKKSKGSTYARLTKQAFVYIWHVYLETFFRPKTRDRSPAGRRRDRLFLTALLPLVLTGFTVLGISANYHLKQNKHARNLTGEFLEFLVKKRAGASREQLYGKILQKGKKWLKK